MTKMISRSPTDAFARLPRYAREAAYQAARTMYGPSEKLSIEMMLYAHKELV